ncbi:MAG: DUF4434 domain-containing protein [Clostridia bacterium]|nr:DUF4434 domain-containing protein [Clostridia bacterium]
MRHSTKKMRRLLRLPAIGLLLAGIGGLLMGGACGTPQGDPSSQPDASNPEPSVRDLALDCPYFYEYGCTPTGDDSMTVLTSEAGGTVTLKPKGGETELTLSLTDWSGKARELPVPNGYAAISVDLGAVSRLTGFSLDGLEGECEVYSSTDGYNYSFYEGAFGASGTFDGLEAKALQFLIPYGEDGKTLNRIRIFGSRDRDRKLLSLGASYTGSGKALSAYPDDGTRLTDGKRFHEAGEDTVAGFQGSETDPVTGKTGATVTLDLGSEKNVSDVLFGYYAAPDRKNVYPDRITVRISADGETWTDFGQSYLRGQSGAYGTASRLYFVTHPETVSARYVKIFTYGNAFLSDEIRVYGYDEAVPAPEASPTISQRPSDANMAAYRPCFLNGEKAEELTDRLYTDPVNAAEGKNEIKITLSETVPDVCGVTVTYAGSPEGWAFADENGNALEPVGDTVSTSGSRTDRTWVFRPSAAKEVTLSFQGSSVRLYECGVYASSAQLPVVRGGFYQIPLGGASTDNASNNSPYSWYLQLKGMKDLGMRDVVLQYGASYTDKTTIVNGKRITGAGYTYTPTYGSPDVAGAVLDAADRLGMSVWLGTIHGADFTNPIGNMTQYDAIVRDGILIIEDMQDMYAFHPSFAGFYLADEQCDQWLNLSGGAAAARKVYKGQSDRIRELNPNASVMIAPAIWRSGSALSGADNLYRAIVGENGGRPVVDIVAAQDCLGRLDTLTVSRTVFDEFERCCAEWAKAVRRAGAEFWHDAEVFEQTGTAKRASETRKSLGIESKLSGEIIVFDTPHYMTLFQSGSGDNLRALYMLRHTREYAKYYASLRELDRMGENARAVSPETNDGRTVPDAGVTGQAGEVHTEVYRPGVVTSGSEPDNWQAFELPNGAGRPEYALSFDGEAFYVSVRPHDATDSYPNGVWWSGEDDLLQIWMMPNGRVSSSVLQEEWGIRFYLHKTAGGWVAGGETGSSKTNISAFSYEKTTDGGEEVLKIRMPWAALGLVPPKAGDGTAIGIVMQYIDGADKSWAASDGTKGQNVPAGALYSF